MLSRLFANLESDDGLASHRERVMYPVSIAALVCLVPFTINNFVQRQYALGVGTTTVMFIFALNSWSIWRGRRPTIPYWVLLLPITIAVTISLRVQGIYGALWCYPILLFFYFVLPRRLATVCSLALMVTASIMASRYIGRDVAIRLFASLTLTVIINNVVHGVIGDLQRQMQRQAIKDPLTGAFNRRHMESRLADEVERHARTGAPASLLLFDIDHFKRVNDRQGHAIGDVVLKALVNLVGRRTRSIDHLFRVGGEEFLLLLPDTAAAEATIAAEHLRHAVAEADLGADDRISISVGVSTFRAGDSPDRWMQRADVCLYDAKQAGRNRVISAESFAAFGRRTAGLS